MGYPALAYQNWKANSNTASGQSCQQRLMISRSPNQSHLGTLIEELDARVCAFERLHQGLKPKPHITKPCLLLPEKGTRAADLAAPGSCSRSSKSHERSTRREAHSATRASDQTMPELSAMSVPRRTARSVSMKLLFQASLAMNHHLRHQVVFETHGTTMTLEL